MFCDMIVSQIFFTTCIIAGTCTEQHLCQAISGFYDTKYALLSLGNGLIENITK